MVDRQLTALPVGTMIPFGGGRYSVVSSELAEAFRPGDHLHVVQPTGALLHIPDAVRAVVDEQVTAAVDAAAELWTVSDERIAGFYTRFATNMADASIWERIADANTADIARATSLGRSTTRLAVSDAMRREMISGLEG